ncbi:MAG: asparagine synthase (glutamine-hydrolyzing) [Aureispira sp.]|nr:asparagine synthase (glutamine-hydrolyzing) [Aureispira sp.]
MCGIGGVFNIKQTEKNKILTIFQDCLKERGPDANDYWANENQFLFHGRLSIIDLSDAGKQPMLTEHTVLSFNGEIYNFKPLRAELEQTGYVFKTGTDSEVLLYGYEHWGIDQLLSKIEGMFAMAIYDKKNQKAYLIRDHFGKKPLYYYKSKKGEIVFSSDIRAIHRLYKPELAVNQQALDYYFVEISVPQPHTIWKGVQQVEPAHYLTIDLEKQTIQEKEYWSIADSYFKQPAFKGGTKEALEQTEELLTQAILKRTVADVPLGCFLSGGVDSGLVVAMLASNSSEQVSTYTIGFDYGEFNELDDAKLIADRYNTNHHEIRLKPNVMDVLPDLIDYYGEPFADSSMIPTYYVCKAIRNDVTVALSGDGGDEGFGGYYNYTKANKWADYFATGNQAWKRKLYVPISKLLSRFSSKFRNYGMYTNEEIGSGLNLINRHMLFPIDNLGKLGRNADFVKQYLNDRLAPFANTNRVDQVMLASLKTRLLNDYLVKVDRASMKNSLEVRSPFLDKTLIEFAMKIPRELKFQGGESKFLLKKLGEKYMYSDIFTKKKRGFAIPINIWFKKELKQFTEERIFDRTFLENYNLNRDYIQKIFQDHISDKGDYRHQIWSLLCLSIWSKKFDV